VGLVSWPPDVSEETETGEDVYEPYCENRFLFKNLPGGRIATPHAY
jgi:Holliday junction resolvasome RuvABC ATP-dependent DNA helicase subunit